VSEYPNIFHVTFGEINEANKTQGHGYECVPPMHQANHLFPQIINQQRRLFAPVAFQLKRSENETGMGTHDVCSRHQYNFESHSEQRQRSSDVPSVGRDRCSFNSAGRDERGVPADVDLSSPLQSWRHCRFPFWTKHPNCSFSK